MVSDDNLKVSSVKEIIKNYRNERYISHPYHHFYRLKKLVVIACALHHVGITPKQTEQNKGSLFSWCTLRLGRALKFSPKKIDKYLRLIEKHIPGFQVSSLSCI